MKTILIVDDEHDIVSTLATVFADEGYRVLVAYDGRQAMAEIARERPDVVLVDFMMPGMSGLQVLEAIRRDPALRAIPVIMTSGMELVDGEANTDWAAFLQKPIDIYAVIQLVAALLA